VLPITPETEGRTLIIACGALVRELRSVLDAAGSASAAQVDVRYLPAPLHNRPERIPGAILELLEATLEPMHSRVLLGYGDCGTGGLLDAELALLRAKGLVIERLPGDHCYEFLAGAASFRELHDDELGTFFVTDYLARHFETLIWQTFRFDEHPELIPMVFANYTRLVYLSQTSNQSVRAELQAEARRAAARLGLSFETNHTGLEPFNEAVVRLIQRAPVS